MDQVVFFVGLNMNPKKRCVRMHIKGPGIDEPTQLPEHPVHGAIQIALFRLNGLGYEVFSVTRESGRVISEENYLLFANERSGETARVERGRPLVEED